MNSRVVMAIKKLAAQLLAIPAMYLIILPLLKNDISTFYEFGRWVPTQWVYLIALAVLASALFVCAYKPMLADPIAAYKNPFKILAFTFSTFYLLLFGIHIYSHVSGFNPQLLQLLNAVMTILCVYMAAIYIVGWTVWAAVFRPRAHATTI